MPRRTDMGNDSRERNRLCGGLLGCGDDGGRQYMVEPDAVEAALTTRTGDRLQHMDELNQEALEPYVATYRVSRRRLVGAGGLLSLLATVAPTSLLTACSAPRRHRRVWGTGPHGGVHGGNGASGRLRRNSTRRRTDRLRRHRGIPQHLDPLHEPVPARRLDPATRPVSP